MSSEQAQAIIEALEGIKFAVISMGAVIGIWLGVAAVAAAGINRSLKNGNK